MTPLILPILEIGKTLISKMWPDPAQQAEAQFKLLQLQQNGELKQLEADVQVALAQIGVNAEDAKSGSLFRGGWRPSIGWGCSSGIWYQFLIRPILNGAFVAFGHSAPLPELDTSTLMALVTGLLGLGGLRTVEKLRGQS